MNKNKSNLKFIEEYVTADNENIYISSRGFKDFWAKGKINITNVAG